MYVNGNFSKLSKNYLFTEIAARIKRYETQTGKKALRLSVGDVVYPLPSVVVQAMIRAAKEMGKASTFRGYGEERGYAFLRQAVAADYERRGVFVDADDVFISDGAKSDCGNLTELFSEKNTVLLPDPVYPVYFDSSVLSGKKTAFFRADEKTGYLPMPNEKTRADVIYLCSPNNPTGAAYSREQLAQWVAYANGRGAVILYDASYAAFIDEAQAREGIARSIYEIEGAKSCAIEISSFSKSAGFTGVRCAYSIVPSALKRNGVSLKEAWARRQATKFNGVSYVTQRAAEAALSAEGRDKNAEIVKKYMGNARILKDTLRRNGCTCTGGEFAPYIWCKRPFGKSDDEFFDGLLYGAGIACTPGYGFGKGGAGYFRFSAFCFEEAAKEAAVLIDAFFKKHAVESQRL